MHCLHQNCRDSSFEKAPPTELVVQQGHGMVRRAYGGEVSHLSSITPTKIAGEALDEYWGSVVVIQPFFEFVYHLNEDLSPSLIETSGEVVNIFISLFAAWAHVPDSLLPFGEMSIDTTHTSNVF